MVLPVIPGMGPWTSWASYDRITVRGDSMSTAREGVYALGIVLPSGVLPVYIGCSVGLQKELLQRITYMHGFTDGNAPFEFVLRHAKPERRVYAYAYSANSLGVEEQLIKRMFPTILNTLHRGENNMQKSQDRAMEVMQQYVQECPEDEVNVPERPWPARANVATSRVPLDSRAVAARRLLDLPPDFLIDRLLEVLTDPEAPQSHIRALVRILEDAAWERKIRSAQTDEMVGARPPGL